MTSLDHNATTPIAAEVLDAMRRYLDQRFDNRSTSHAYGAAHTGPIIIKPSKEEPAWLPTAE